jgi:hypothetical protein
MTSVGHRLENSQKSSGRVAQQSGVSVGSAWTATELLHIQPFKITVVPEIKPVNYEKKSEILLSGLSVMYVTDLLILSLHFHRSG